MTAKENSIRSWAKVALLAASVIGILAGAQRIPAQRTPPPGSGEVTNPLLPENSARQVSDHVYVIMGFPNVGIVIGSRATLVVDTGLGPRNGAVAAGEAKRLSKNSILYLTTTHFHPEHAAGEAGFPANTILIRPAAQQSELETDGAAMMDRFRSMSAENEELLRGVKFRPPDITFDKEATLDLGGVTVRLSWLGAAHTAGDELIYVLPDKTLLPGDVVQNKMLPNLPGPRASLNHWILILGQLRSLNVRYVVPDHGALGDGSLIGQEYNFLANLKSRALELKRQGKSAAEAGAIVLTEFKKKYPDWPNLNNLPNLVGKIYSENP